MNYIIGGDMLGAVLRVICLYPFLLCMGAMFLFCIVIALNIIFSDKK